MLVKVHVTVRVRVIEPRLQAYVQSADVAIVEQRRPRSQPRRRVPALGADSYGAEGERVEIDVGVERVRHGHFGGRQRCGGDVLEVNRVGQVVLAGDEALRSDHGARRAVDRVGVAGQEVLDDPHPVDLLDLRLPPRHVLVHLRWVHAVPPRPGAVERPRRKVIDRRIDGVDEQARLEREERFQEPLRHLANAPHPVAGALLHRFPGLDPVEQPAKQLEPGTYLRIEGLRLPDRLVGTLDLLDAFRGPLPVPGNICDDDVQIVDHPHHVPGQVRVDEEVLEPRGEQTHAVRVVGDLGAARVEAEPLRPRVGVGHELGVLATTRVDAVDRVARRPTGRVRGCEERGVFRQEATNARVVDACAGVDQPARLRAQPPVPLECERLDRRTGPARDLAERQIPVGVGDRTAGASERQHIAARIGRVN